MSAQQTAIEPLPASGQYHHKHKCQRKDPHSDLARMTAMEDGSNRLRYGYEQQQYAQLANTTLASDRHGVAFPDT